MVSSPASRKSTSAPLRLLRSQAGYLVFIVIVVLFSLTSKATVSLGIYVLIYGIAAIGLMLLMGLAGQVSLGHAGFFAIGAYTQAILTTRYEINWMLAVIPAVLIAMIAALLLGVPLLRLRGHYLALATLGLGIIIGVVANQSEFMGGASGIFGVRKPEIAGFAFKSPLEFYWLLVPILFICVILARNIVDSRIGRGLQAIKDSEVASETLGVNAFKLRLTVFVISAGFAGLGGVFYAHWTAVVSPEIAGFQFSIMFLMMVILGGIGSVWGAVVGALGAVFLEEGMRRLLPLVIPNAGGEVQMLGWGLVLVVLLILLPGGLHQLAGMVWSRLTRRRIVRGLKAAQSEAGESGAVVHTRLLEAKGGALLAPAKPQDPGTALMQAKGLTKHFNGIVAVEDLSFEVCAGEILALIGPNGAGKTTCFNMMTGVIPPTSGTVHLGGRDVQKRKPHVIAELGATRTFQNLQVFGTASVLDNVKVGRHLRSKRGVVAAALRVPAMKEEREITRDAQALVEGLGLAEVANRPVSELSFGTQRLTEIARALALQPEVLLLDEPMAGLSPAERAKLADLLRIVRESGIAILIVEHDMTQVMALADRVAVLDKGCLIALGTPDEVRTDPEVIAAYLGVEEETVRAEAADGRGDD